MKNKVLSYISLAMCLMLFVNVTGCKKKTEEKEKNLSIYMDIKDRNTVDMIKYITEEYSKENEKVKLKFNSSVGSSNIVEDINKGSEADIMFIPRNTMIELTKKGLLSEMGSFYEKGKINEDYFNVMSDYGRVEDKYYGIALTPSIVEVVYNKQAMKNLGLAEPQNFQDLVAVLKKLKASNTRIPVLLPEDIDKNLGVASIIACNKVKGKTLEASFNGGKEEYKNMKEMQAVFDYVNDLVKSGVVDNNSFELGNENSLTSLNKGTVPLAITLSDYNNTLKKESVGIAKDYSINSGEKSHVPVIVNALVSMPTNAKNGEEAASFIKFLLSEDFQKKLVEKGFISGNKKANADATGLNKDIIENIFNSGENSILFIYNLPPKLSEEVMLKLNNVFNGRYTGKEWQEAVENSI